MDPTGPRIAQGRDAVIYEHGPGRVLRRSGSGHSMVGEARTMEFARSHGYPVPRVHDAGDGYMVMDRLHGTSLLEWALPFRIGVAGRLLGRLHNRLHELHAPAALQRRAAVDGDRLLHGDLHALNVMVTDDGPMVIDWANAMVGDPAFDVADCWAVMACADTPEGTPTWLASAARRWFLRSFLRTADADGRARTVAAAAARARAEDHNITQEERERLAGFSRRRSWVAGRGA